MALARTGLALALLLVTRAAANTLVCTCTFLYLIDDTLLRNNCVGSDKVKAFLDVLALLE